MLILGFILYSEALLIQDKKGKIHLIMPQD